MQLIVFNQLFDLAQTGYTLDSVTFTRAPATGKNPGYIYVHAGNEYRGKISPEGEITINRIRADHETLDRLYIGIVNRVITQIERDFAHVTDTTNTADEIKMDDFVARLKGIREMQKEEWAEDELDDDFDYWTDYKADVVGYERFKEAFQSRDGQDVEEVLDEMESALRAEVLVAGFDEDALTCALMAR